MKKEPDIILFDGICNLCDKSVQFIIKRDKNDRYQFASLQSKEGISLLKKFNLPIEYTDSIVLITNNKVFLKADAALEIAGHLSFPWSFLKYFKSAPSWFTNFWYDLIAKYRYSFFGKKEEVCELIHQKKRYRSTEI